MPPIRKILRRTLLVVAALLGLLIVIVGIGWWYFHPSVSRTNSITYGKRGDAPLGLDVLKPRRPNGIGIIVIVSGGWKSAKPGSFDSWIVAPLLRRGYTVFPVYHVSQPKGSVMEAIQDMHRAVRFIRVHAREYGIDPDRLGVTGASAGGHLSLMLATTGGPGRPDAADEVDRASSAVQAVAIFFPVTDLLNLGKSRENLHDGGPPKSFRRAFGPDGTNLAAWKLIGRESSPIYHVKSNLPPVLILHGDADTLTPLEQSEWFQAKAREVGREVKIVVKRGGDHGWATIPLDLRQFGKWFDERLRRE